MGGAQGIAYLASLIRIKVVALVLGPTGVGIVGLYMAATALISSVTGLGIQGSAVRTIAKASNENDPVSVALAVRALRRVCWLTGVLGWLTSLLLAWTLSHWLFDSAEHVLALAVLGVVPLLSAISGGQMAVLQGLRRIGDIARVQAIGAIYNTIVTSVLYIWLGAAGIVPVIIATAGVSLGLSWWFARRVHVEHVQLSWRDTFQAALPILRLGVALMWSGLLVLGCDLFTLTFISRELGVDAVGIYQAAWALSGMFAAFILKAMGTDFYPRLTAVIHDRAAGIRAVNEQTEVGVLLALPGLLGTLALAHWIVLLFYSVEFLAAADTLVWMLVGVLGRLISWPLGFIQLALGASRLFVCTETVFVAIRAGLVFILVPIYGVQGAAIAFALIYILYTIFMLYLNYRLIGFKWSREVKILVAVSVTLLLVNLTIYHYFESGVTTFFGVLIAIIAGFYCLHEVLGKVNISGGVVAKLVRGYSAIGWPIKGDR
jgi:PST family polysaccharide transporter